MVENKDQNEETLEEQDGKKKKKKKNAAGLNAFVLMFIIVMVISVLTFLVPSGEFERTEIDGRTVVVPDTFEEVEVENLSLMDIFMSFHTGLVNSADIVFTVFIFGGAIGIMNHTGALDSMIKRLVSIFRDRAYILISVLVLVFALLGSLIGLAEETLVYIPIIIPLMIAFRFDAITAVAVVFLGVLGAGFTSALTNPYTVGVAQTIAELPYMSGWEMRLPIFITFYLVTIWYIIRHANKVKKNPDLAINGSYDANSGVDIDWDYKMPMRHLISIIVFALGIGLLIYGVISHGWYVGEISAVILGTGVIMGLISRLKLNEIGEGFVKGARDIAVGALIIGFARAIVIVMEQGYMLDVVLNIASGLLDSLPVEIAAVGMFITQLFINFFVPSGSGQAALTIPVMAPLSDLLGITRQTAVLAFQLGDGIANIIVPTFGVLLAALSIAGISYGKWLKWVLPYFLIQVGLGIIFIIIAQYIELGPF